LGSIFTFAYFYFCGTVWEPTSRVLQRKCACGQQKSAQNDDCEECQKKRLMLQRETSGHSGNTVDQQLVTDVLHSSGQPLNKVTRDFMEPRFGHDFSQVRVHYDGQAAASAKAVNALAYTVGNDVVFDSGRYAPNTREGRHLLAHELTHTIQQRSAAQASVQTPVLSGSSAAAERQAHKTAVDIMQGVKPQNVLSAPVQLARVCSDASTCSAGGVPGSATEFGNTEEAVEVGPRARRQRMDPARAVSTGHAGRASQLETFLSAEEPGRMAHIQGIFIDADLSSGTGALTQDCGDWVLEALPAASPTPAGMAGASKDCTFVHGQLNREALVFNSGASAIVGGQSREEWRVNTLQILIHETEHPRFESATAGSARPAAVTSATCTRSNIVGELSEIAAMMSEFPTISRSAAANPAGPITAMLDPWFEEIIFTGGENINGALLEIGCSCECPEVDAFVKQTSDEVTTTGGWTPAEKNAFHGKLRTELAGPVRPIWPG